MIEEEGKFMTLFCPYIKAKCVGSRCVVWKEIRITKDYEGKEIKVGRCDYGRNK